MYRTGVVFSVTGLCCAVVCTPTLHRYGTTCRYTRTVTASSHSSGSMFCVHDQLHQLCSCVCVCVCVCTHVCVRVCVCVCVCVCVLCVCVCVCAHACVCTHV